MTSPLSRRALVSTHPRSEFAAFVPRSSKAAPNGARFDSPGRAKRSPGYLANPTQSPIGARFPNPTQSARQIRSHDFANGIALFPTGISPRWGFAADDSMLPGAERPG